MYPSNRPPPQGAFGQPPQTTFGQSPQAAYGQPQMAQYANGVPLQPNIKWSTGLCGCGDNVSNCCITCWCPCITFGQIAEIADRGATFLFLRVTKSCGVHGVFYTTHGFDMSLGWDGNMARQNQGFAMPPFPPAEMRR
nr:hypothetical protein [Tanacetum cinerariifolium]